MSVLHPVGPEATETYWARRVIVIVAAVVVLAVLIAVIVNATSGTTATPAPGAKPTAAFGSPTPTAMTTELRTPGASDSSATNTSKPKAAAGPASSSTSSSSSKSTSSSSAPTTSSPTACPADQLRVTLTGKQRLKVKKSNTFNLSVINGSGQTCVATISPDNFELKIYSGTDRIWTTDDCASKVKKISKTLAAERSTSWTMIWNGRRSNAGCKQRAEVPRSGTYFATAQLKDAKPVQLRMILRG